MLKATCFDHDRIILNQAPAGFDSRLSVRPADRPCHMRNRLRHRMSSLHRRSGVVSLMFSVPFGAGWPGVRFGRGSVRDFQKEAHWLRRAAAGR